MCMNGAFMGCGAPKDGQSCGAKAQFSPLAVPVQPEIPPPQRTPPGGPEPAGEPEDQPAQSSFLNPDILKGVPKLACAQNQGKCYSSDQFEKIKTTLSDQYKDVRLNDVGFIQSILSIFGKDVPARNLGEAARNTLNHPDVKGLKEIGEGQMNNLVSYLEREKAQMTEINKSKDEDVRRAAMEKAKGELAGAMSPDLVGAPLHHGLMKSGDYLTSRAMGGPDYVKKEPGYSGAWDHWARESYNSGKYKDAAGQAGKALELDPKNATALSVRAGAEFKQGDFPGAASDAKAALALNPKDSNAFSVYQLSAGRDVASGSGDPGKAGVSSDGAGSSSGLSSNLHLTSPAAGQSAQWAKQAQTSLGMRDYRAAIDQASRALALDPNNLAALEARARAHNASGNYAAALQDAVASLQLSPKSGFALNAKAYALNKLKQYQAAREAADAALALNPKDAAAHANRAYALGGLGDKAGMLAALKTAASIDSKYESSLKSALQAPADGDVVFLFPGEERVQAAAAKPAAAPSRGRRFGALGFSTVIGGLLLGLGMLPIALPLFTRRVKSFVAEQNTRRPAVTAMAPAPETLRGQYEIVRPIGEGGMGLVYEGKDTSLDRRVAIKKMRPELAADRRERERFLSEARMVATLHHPNIVDIFAIVEEEGGVYLVFEFVAGKTLHEIIASRGWLPLAEAAALIRGMAGALEFAHAKGIIHRDLKPSNVMLDLEGRVKVMDFGIARVAKDAATKFSVTNTVIGTPPYMAPEQEQGVVAKQSDVYALAVCFYEMLTGRVPFTGGGSGMLMNKVNMVYEPVTRLTPGLPPGLDGFFVRAFAPDPEKRLSSPGEFLRALDSAAALTAGR